MRKMSLEELAKRGGLVWAAWLWRIAEKRDAASHGPGTSP
jgi:hypothetical protein